LNMRASAAIVAAHSAQKHRLKQQASRRSAGRTFCAPCIFSPPDTKESPC
jgi:hypothetical protein